MNEFTTRELCEMALQFERMGNYKSADIIDNIMVRTAGIPRIVTSQGIMPNYDPQFRTQPTSGAMPPYDSSSVSTPQKGTRTKGTRAKGTRTKGTRTKGTRAKTTGTKVAPPLKTNPVLDMGNRALGIGNTPVEAIPAINNPIPTNQPWPRNTWDMFGRSPAGQSPVTPEVSKSWGQGEINNFGRKNKFKIPNGENVYNRPVTQPAASLPEFEVAGPRQRFHTSENLPQLTPEELFNESSTRMTRMTDPALSRGTRMTKSLGEVAKNFGKNFSIKNIGKSIGKGTPIAGAVELASRIPAGDMLNAGINNWRMNNKLDQLSPERRAWMMKNAPGLLQENDPGETFGKGNGWGGTFSDFYTGKNARENIMDVAAAPIAAATWGIGDIPEWWGGTGLTRALKNYGASADQRNQIKQQNVPQSQQMRQNSPHAQAQWTQDQLNQNISQKFQQMNQLSNDPSPQARARSNQLYKEIQWLRNNFSA